MLQRSSISAKIAKRARYLPQLIALSANGIGAGAKQSLSSFFKEVPETNTRSKCWDGFGLRHNAAPCLGGSVTNSQSPMNAEYGAAMGD